jgi:hypothetical protein
VQPVARSAMRCLDGAADTVAARIASANARRMMSEGTGICESKVNEGQTRELQRISAGSLQWPESKVLYSFDEHRGVVALKELSRRTSKRSG